MFAKNTKLNYGDLIQFCVDELAKAQLASFNIIEEWTLTIYIDACYSGNAIEYIK